MSNRTTWLFTVVSVVLVCGQASFGLSGDISLTSNVPDPDNVSPGSSITVSVAGTQSDAATGLNEIKLNWSSSSSEWNLDSAGTWVWHGDTDAFDAAEENFVTDDDNLSDFIVDRLGYGYLTAASFNIGTLTFNAPSPPTPTTYYLDLTGYSTNGVDNTWFNEGSTFIIYGLDLTFSAGSDLNFDGSSVYSLTVLPEPTCVVLLAAGGLGALLRRRKKA